MRADQGQRNRRDSGHDLVDRRPLIPLRYRLRTVRRPARLRWRLQQVWTLKTRSGKRPADAGLRVERVAQSLRLGRIPEQDLTRVSAVAAIEPPHPFVSRAVRCRPRTNCGSDGAAGCGVVHAPDEQIQSAVHPAEDLCV